MKKNFLSFAFLLWIILASHSIVFSQVENKGLQWTKIESPKGDLTFSVPPDFLIDNEDKSYRAIGYLNEVTMNVTIEVTGDAQNRIKRMRQFPTKTQSKISSFTLDKFIGDVHTFEKPGVFSMSIYAASLKEFYTITVVSKNSTNSVVSDFLNSIRMGDRPLLKQEPQPVQKDEIKVSIASLKTSPVILEALKRKDGKRIKLKYDLKSGENLTGTENDEESAKYSRQLIVLRKPRPSYTDEGRRNIVTGNIKIKAVFLANGEIGDIVILTKLGSGLDENAAIAARKIKFLPAEIDGKPVDTSKVIEYNFAIY